MTQLDLFKPFHPNVSVYFKELSKNAFGVIEVSDVESVQQCFDEVHSVLDAGKIEYKKPMLGFIKGNKYGQPN